METSGWGRQPDTGKRHEVITRGEHRSKQKSYKNKEKNSLQNKGGKTKTQVTLHKEKTHSNPQLDIHSERN